MPDNAKISDLLAMPLVSGFAAGKASQAEDEQEGIVQIRPTNVLPEGEITLEGSKFVPEIGLTHEDYIQPGEILFNNTNSSALVGKTALFRLKGRYVCSNHITRIRPNEKVMPEYLVAVLNSLWSAGYFSRLSTNFNNQAGVNTETLSEVEIPLPPIQKQRSLVAELDGARQVRRQKLAHADGLLAGLDAYLLEQLGITPPQEDKRQVFAVQLGEVRGTSRLNSDYFHPERVLAIRAMQEKQEGLRVERLTDIAHFIRDLATVTAEDRYIGLASVQSNTGELVDTIAEEAQGTCLRFAANDILFARLRPYLNKVHRAEKDGVCSTEFHVIRLHPDNRILPDYLATVLRSTLILVQTRHMMTGNTHPRLTNEDVVNLVVPIPELPVQQAIASEVKRRREQARHLRAEAAAEWAMAKQRFEQHLIGEVNR